MTAAAPGSTAGGAPSPATGGAAPGPATAQEASRPPGPAGRRVPRAGHTAPPLRTAPPCVQDAQGNTCVLVSAAPMESADVAALVMPAPNVEAAALVAAKVGNLRSVSAEDGLRYSPLGYIIESMNRALTDADFYAALELMHAAIQAGADVHAPCWAATIDPKGTEYYPPLEYLCVLNLCRLKCDDVANAARAVALAGARLHPELLHDHALRHAQRVLGLTLTAQS